MLQPIPTPVIHDAGSTDSVADTTPVIIDAADAGPDGNVVIVVDAADAAADAGPDGLVVLLDAQADGVADAPELDASVVDGSVTDGGGCEGDAAMRTPSQVTNWMAGCPPASPRREEREQESPGTLSWTAATSS